MNVGDDSGSGVSTRRAVNDAAAEADHGAGGALSDAAGAAHAAGAADVPSAPDAAGAAGAAWGGRRGTDSDRAGGRRTDFVQSLDRGLAVIRCFSSEHPSLTLSEVAERTGLTRAAARRARLQQPAAPALRAADHRIAFR